MSVWLLTLYVFILLTTASHPECIRVIIKIVNICLIMLILTIIKHFVPNKKVFPEK